MTPREKREMLTDAIAEDIMSNLTDFNLCILSDALGEYLAKWSDEEIENEYKERALS